MKTVVFVLSALVFVSPVANAQALEDECVIKQATKLFVAQDGAKYVTRLAAETKLTLKVAHKTRWMVETKSGQMGFINTAWLNRVCTYTKPAPQKPKPAPAVPEQSTKTNPVQDIVMASAKLDVAAVTAKEAPESISEAAPKPGAETDREIKCLETRESALLRVAVYDFKLTNVADNLGRLMTNSVLEEIRKLEGVSAIGMDEIREMLDFEAQRQAIGCEADDACLAQIAGALGVDELVLGTLADGEHGRTVSIRRIDQMRAEVMQALNQRLESGDGEEFLLAIGPGIEKLYPGIANRPGTKRGVEEKVLLRVNPPPIPRTWTLSATGGALLTLAVGGAFAYLGTDDVRSYETGAGLSPGRVGATKFDKLRTSGERNLKIGNAGLVTGGSLALGAIVMSFFTDWYGYGDEDSE